jgi:hypothetical protein
MTSDGKVPDDRGRVPDHLAGGPDTGVEERYRPYRRPAGDVPRPWKLPGRSSAGSPRRGKVGPRLYWYAPPSSPIRRVGRSLAVVAVLASVVWGVTSLRGADGTSLADLERVPRTLLDEVPRLVMEGIESMPAILRPEASGGSRSGPEGPTAGPAVDGAPEQVPAAPAAEDVAPTVDADALTDGPQADNRGTSAPDAEAEGNGVPERGAASPTPSSDLPARSDPQPAAADPRVETSPPDALTPPPVLPVPPAPEPVPAPGSLFLQAYPWGRVYIDGVYVADTPLLGIEVGAGLHSIRIERPGYEPHVEYVVVEPAQALRLTGIILKRGRP